jgi:hypothetical protein
VDRDGAAEQVAITLTLAKMWTDSAEGCGQRITGTQQPGGPDKIAAGQQQDDPGNIVPRRARV